MLELLQEAGLTSTALIIWSVYIGIVIASVIALFQKRYEGNFVRKLINEGCNSPETAKTLSELGAGKSGLLRASLRSGDALSSTVFAVFSDITDGKMVRELRREEKNSDEVRYYIPADKCDLAWIRFEKKGTHIMGVIAAVVVFGILAALAVEYLPKIVEIAREFISSAE